MDFPLWAQSLLNGLIGSFMYIIVQSLGWQDKEGAGRRMGAGMASGFAVYLLGYSAAIFIIAVSYMAIDITEAVIERYKRTDRL